MLVQVGCPHTDDHFRNILVTAPCCASQCTYRSLQFEDFLTDDLFRHILVNVSRQQIHRPFLGAYRRYPGLVLPAFIP